MTDLPLTGGCNCGAVRFEAIDRSEFLVAATGAPDSRAAADALVTERLAQQTA